MASGAEIFPRLTAKMMRHILLERLQKLLLILYPGATPRDDVVCHSLIYRTEKGDTPYAL